MIYDVAAKAAKDVSSRDLDVDPGSPQWSADGRQILFVAGKRAYSEVFSYDLAIGKYAQLTKQKTLQYGSRSKDGKVVAVTMDSPTMPAKCTSPMRRSQASAS